nr:MAG TPA: HOMEOBOX PROTEIN PAX-6/DNA COMPLEX, PAIRED DOMAIN, TRANSCRIPTION, PROTEIN-DNA.5A [Caudoviricetes sp.]
MSKPRYSWWGYVKAIIRRYEPDQEPELHGVPLKESCAVSEAVGETGALQDGDDRLKFIRLVFWDKTHTLEGAAMAVNCSERTARRWHTDFIKCVARNYGLLDD